MDAIAHTQVSAVCLVTLAVLLRAQQKMRDKSLPGRLFTALLWFAGALTIVDHGSALAQLGAQRVAVAMSCGLTQRGALPLLPEAVRVQAALACGADLVFALPAPCACAGAEAFARAGVRILAAAGCDALVFGAETPDTALLQKAARV